MSSHPGRSMRFLNKKKINDRISSTIKFIVLTFLVLLLPSVMHAQTRTVDLICDDWPPYQIVQKNDVSGFSTRIVETVFERMNVNINSLEVYPWKRAVNLIKEGKVDALFSANYTEKRTEFAYYPEEALVKSPWVMWVRENDQVKFESLNDLIGKKVGLVRGYSYTPQLWEFVKKHNNYEEVSKDVQNFKKLNLKRIDFVLSEFRNGSYVVKLLNLEKIIPLLMVPVKTDGLFIIFSKKNVSKSFVDEFSDELRKLKQEPIYESLKQEYLFFRYNRNSE